jgi:hypothetical protein
VNNDAINMGVLVCNLTYIPLGISLGVQLMDHSSIIGCSVFSFLRSVYIVFHSDCTNLHSHQQCMRVSSSPYPCQHLLCVVFLMVAILTGVRSNLYMILTWSSFMARDVEHFLMCFLAILTYSFEKTLFSSFSHFFIGS